MKTTMTYDRDFNHYLLTLDYTGNPYTNLVEYILDNELLKNILFKNNLTELASMCITLEVLNLKCNNFKFKLYNLDKKYQIVLRLNTIKGNSIKLYGVNKVHYISSEIHTTSIKSRHIREITFSRSTIKEFHTHQPIDLIHMSYSNIKLMKVIYIGNMYTSYSCIDNMYGFVSGTIQISNNKDCIRNKLIKVSNSLSKVDKISGDVFDYMIKRII